MNLAAPPLKNDRFIRALLRQPVDVTPIWIMRQAGRYLPEYRAIRSLKQDFLALCKTPELACEITLQPLERFDLDAAILFSDILTIPDAMGLGLYFEKGEGPRFHYPVQSEKDIERLRLPTVNEELSYVMEAIHCVQSELKGKVPLIGFSGSPWTLATYMVEGGSSKSFLRIKEMLYARPLVLHSLLHKLTDAVSDYLNAQIKAGVHAVMVFDTWGGVLTTQDYLSFSLHYMRQIIERIEKKVPVIVFTKNGAQWLETIVESGCEGVGVDWTLDLAEARLRVKDRVALQGNMEPAVLYAHPDNIRNEVKRILKSYGKGSGHIFNLGHGIHPNTSPENVKVLVDAVHELSQCYHDER